jgi:hypothetical protein
MFGKHHTLEQLSMGIAVTASLVVVAAPSALGAHYGNAVSQSTNRPSVPFVTDTLGGNGQVSQLRRYNPQAYVYGGASPAVSKAIQAVGHGRAVSSSPVVSSPSGNGFDWSAAGVGAGVIAGGLLLLLLCGTLLRMNKRGAITT